MRKPVLMLLAVLTFTPALFAKSHHDWEHVEKLKPGSSVVVFLWNGRHIGGSVDRVGLASLRIDIADPEVGVGALEDFNRAEVRKIVRVRRPNLPDPQRWILIGTLAGGGAGFISGAIYDATHHEDYHWLTGGLGGAGLGFLGSCVILAGVGVVDLFRRHDTLVYEDQRSGQAIGG